MSIHVQFISIYLNLRAYCATNLHKKTTAIAQGKLKSPPDNKYLSEFKACLSAVYRLLIFVYICSVSQPRTCIRDTPGVMRAKDKVESSCTILLYHD
jgi:hypothetical protein